MRATFRLSGAGSEIDLRVPFVHRALVAGRIRTGFPIDNARTVDADAQPELILRDLLECQLPLAGAR